MHRARVNESTSYDFQVLDYRSSQVFPRPQDKLLDKYPDAAAAYGLRLLRSAYLGPAIRVRRASDNAEKDIYFDGQGNLDTGDLVAFAGGSSFIGSRRGTTSRATATTHNRQRRQITATHLAVGRGRSSRSTASPPSTSTEATTRSALTALTCTGKTAWTHICTIKRTTIRSSC